MADFVEGASLVTGGDCPSRTPEKPRLIDGAIPRSPILAGMKHGVFALVDRRGEPLLQPGGRLVELRIEPCRSRQWLHVDFVLRRCKLARLVPSLLLRGNLLVDLGMARLVTCLDDENIVPFFVCGGLAKAILQRGAKWRI